MSIRRVVLCALLLAGLAMCGSGAEGAKAKATRFDLPALLAKVRPATVTVVAYGEKDEEESQGTGFITSADGVVVTALHVIGGYPSAVVKLQNGAFFPVKGVLAWGEDVDYVVLKVDARGLPTVPLGDSAKVQAGQRVFLVGSPSGLEQTASEGIVSAIRVVGDRAKYLQTTAAMSPGSSGGPLCNEAGEVIGVASRQMEEGQQLNFAVAINLIKPGLKAATKVHPLAELVEKSVGMSADDLCDRAKALREAEEEAEPEAKYEAALALYQKAIARDASNARGYFGAGICLRALDRYAEALAHDQKAFPLLTEDVEVAAGHAALGLDFSALSRDAEACAEFKEAVRLDPGRSQYRVFLAEAYQALGEDRDALKEYREAVRLAPEEAETWEEMAGCLSDLGRWDEAIEPAARAVKLVPDDIEFRRSLATVYERLGRESDAITTLREALVVDPSDELARRDLACLYTEAKQWKEAMAVWEDLLARDPGSFWAPWGLGEVYRIMGKYDDSLAWYERALAKNSKGEGSYVGIGDVRTAQGRWQEAVTAYAKALELDADRDSCRVSLGKAYLKLGKRAEALEQHRELSKRDPELAKELFDLLYPAENEIPAKGK
jgi:tetratricopeptide (TPR) repeat protein